MRLRFNICQWRIGFVIGPLFRYDPEIFEGKRGEIGAWYFEISIPTLTLEHTFWKHEPDAPEKEKKNGNT